MGWSGTARRNENEIHISISVALLEANWEAEVNDIYPGGRRTYAQDPGAAQVFLKLTKKATDAVNRVLDFQQKITIKDDRKYESVDVIGVNGNTGEEYRLGSLSITAEPDQFIVTALTSSVPTGRLLACTIRPQDELFAGIYTAVFGPDSREACERYIESHCLGGFRITGGGVGDPFPLRAGGDEPFPLVRAAEPGSQTS